MKVGVVGLASLLVVSSVVLGPAGSARPCALRRKAWRCAVDEPGSAGSAQRDGYGRTGIRSVSRRLDARRSAKT